jgi:hypothetical protein
LVLAEQVVESQRRRRFAEAILKLPYTGRVADPEDSVFDPIRAAVYYSRQGNPHEALWMVFLFTHFGKHRHREYQLPALVYAGDGNLWTFSAVSSDPDAFRRWLQTAEPRLKAAGVRFGNHRKYESLDAWTPNGTGSVVATYVAWFEAHQRELVSDQGTEHERFEGLYRSMGSVARFGRTGRFDFLNMAGKLRLAAVSPGRAFFSGSSGPLAGARLLYGDGRLTAAAAEDRVHASNQRWGLTYDVIEDALCNWQKSPDAFIAFRG